MIYEPFDVVVVPFPFTNSSRTKRRPALVLSPRAAFGAVIEHSILAMITSQKNVPWPLDVAIQDKKRSGLTAPSVVRMKLFTLDNRFILKKIGHLSEGDRNRVTDSLVRIFGYLPIEPNLNQNR